MKITKVQAAVLSNHEVLSHLLSLSPPTATTATTSTQTTISAREPSQLPTPPPSTKPLKAPNYETVLKELKDYLTNGAPHPTSSTTTTTSPSPLPPHLSAAQIRKLTEGLKPYNLTKAEATMILNLRPRDLGFLDCVIEECDERFSAEQQEGILRVVEGVWGDGMDGEERGRGGGG